MARHLLILHPADPHALVEPARLEQQLRALELIADPMPQGTGHYRPGEAFLEQISFLGCSPVVALGEPGATADICHLELPIPSPTPRFLAGDNLKAPRCPACGYASPEGREIGAAWEDDPHTPWTCPLCGKSYYAPELRWRQSAGFGRSAVRIWGIFEGEAVPGELLLQAVAQLSGGPWKYFYCAVSD